MLGELGDPGVASVFQEIEGPRIYIDYVCNVKCSMKTNYQYMVSNDPEHLPRRL